MDLLVVALGFAVLSPRCLAASRFQITLPVTGTGRLEVEHCCVISLAVEPHLGRLELNTHNMIHRALLLLGGTFDLLYREWDCWTHLWTVVQIRAYLTIICALSFALPRTSINKASDRICLLSRSHPALAPPSRLAARILEWT